MVSGSVDADAEAIAGAIEPEAAEPVESVEAGEAAHAGARAELSVVPISGELGLVDLRVMGPDATAVTAEVRVDGRDDPLSVPLRAPRQPDGPWTARVMAGSAPAPTRIADEPVELRLVIQTPAGTTTTDWSSHAASPPEPERAPAWAMGAVWYQIFPERFANGNPDNDPRGPDTTLLAWNADWGRTSVFEVEQAWAQHAVDPRFNRPIGGEALPSLIYRRRFGGDLQGVVEKLDHLDDLGITALYLCPVFHAQSMHKYEAADHRHIDPAFGDPGTPAPSSSMDSAIVHDPEESAELSTWKWTDADRYLVDTLLPEARARGMRVILDGVWNHVGLWNWAFMDVVEQGTRSPYAEWFDCRFDGEGNLIGWEGWARTNGSLPEFTHTDDGDLHPEVKAFLFDVTRRWMDPNNDGDPSDGIDGWRLDVAAEVGRTFWRDWRELVRSINPDALLVGELWFPGRDYFDGTAFDSQMNYPFAFALTDWLALDPSVSGNQLGAILERVYANAPHTDLAQMNLLVSHDTEHLASLMMNPNREYEQGASRFGNTGYDAGPPDDRAKALSVLAAALQATLPGSPMIYNGDELGMAGADDPDNRRPLPWPDPAHPFPAGERADPGVLRGYQTWLSHRSPSDTDPDLAAVLRYGDWAPIETENENLFAFSRTLNGREIRVVANRSAEPIEAPELMAGHPVTGTPQNPIVPAFSAVFWHSE